jgi:ComF family protein
MAYEDSVIPLFHRMKYGRRSSYARLFGEIMTRVYETELSRLNLDGIIPIPLHTRRLGQRGFNQASLMARRVGRGVGLTVHDDFLLRTRWTDPQVGLSKAQRVQNVRGAFEVPQPHRIKGGRWLLVDDVFTTGSTLGEAARVLRKAGASEIHVLTAARVV